MSIGAPIDTEQLRKAVQEEYAEVAHHPDKGFHFHTGRTLAGLLEYKDEWLEGIPEDNLASFAGVGKPFTFGALKPGERVVDIGSGAGLDSLIAGKMVGPEGAVVGVDMTPAMLDKARQGAADMSARHVDFREGYMEALPVDDGWADVVISNGVINLSPDKTRVWSEIYRVLKPGGRIQIADIVVGKPVPDSAKEDISLWTGWIAGALLEAETEAAIRAAGFENVYTTPGVDVFSGAPSASSAAAFETRGVQVRATKPGWAMRWHPGPRWLMDGAPGKRGWTGQRADPDVRTLQVGAGPGDATSLQSRVQEAVEGVAPDEPEQLAPAVAPLDSDVNVVVTAGALGLGPHELPGKAKASMRSCTARLSRQALTDRTAVLVDKS